ncbi:MAG: FHA domain-containing protein [Fimbriimonadales bacterium]|nr:FHA domain-containing protein [Fimbriimonadales bacterium]
MQTETTVAVGSEATVAMTPAPQATMAMAPAECPICAQMNPPGEQYCLECGFLLTSVAPEIAEPAGTYPKLRDASGREYLLKAGENIIGRDPSSDVLISDGTVSRRHACITLEENHAYIQDLGSTNGTYLNGEPVGAERIPLPPDAELRFGSVAMTLELPEGFETPAVAAEVAPPLAYLVSLSDAAMRFPLYARPQRIGRRAGNDIVIPDSYVSGQHAVIEIIGADIRITDLGSTNGTFIGETKIAPNMPTTVPADALLTLGKTQFHIEWVSTEPAAEAATETEPDAKTQTETTPTDEAE